MGGALLMSGERGTTSGRCDSSSRSCDDCGLESSAGTEPALRLREWAADEAEGDEATGAAALEGDPPGAAVSGPASVDAISAAPLLLLCANVGLYCCVYESSLARRAAAA